MQKTESKTGLALIAFVMLAAAVLMLYRLGMEPIQDYDEATYAEVVHEALANHNFLSFTFGGANYFQKPPLMFWLMGASESVLGENAFAMRLPAALAGVALIGVVMLIGWEISGEPALAVLAGTTLLTTGPVLEVAQQVRTDTFVILFSMAALYAFIRALRDRRWFLLFGLCLGLAVLSKSVIAIFGFIPAATLILLWRRFDIFKSYYFWSGVGVFLAVVLPWHLWETAHFGIAFWQQYIGTEVIARTQQNLFWTVNITNGQLLQYVWQFTQPWLLIFCAAVLCMLVRFRALGPRRAGFIAACGISIALVAAIFFSAATKAPTYLLPVYPFAALAIAMSVPAISFRPLQWAAGLVAVLIVSGAGAYAVYNAYHFNPYFSAYLALARDEQAVGGILAALPPGAIWYVYDDPNLGSIMFYSQHLETRALAAGAALPSGARIVIDSDAAAQFKRAFPNVPAVVLYAGPQVTLLAAD